MAATVPAAYAAHTPLDISFSEDTVTDLAAMGPGCPTYPGSLSEHRDTTVTGFLDRFGGLHARQDTDATFAITPSDPGAGPSYSGSYREHGVVRAADPDAEDPLNGQMLMHAVATGTDGSTLHLLLSEHWVVDGNGTVRVDRTRVTCS